MMTCRELAELLIDFVSEELHEEHRLRVEEHLSCCTHCVTYVETYRITIQLTRQLPREPLPPQLVERLEAALQHLRSEPHEA